MAKKYRVVLFGIRLDREIFRQNMARLGVPDSTLDKYMIKVPAVLKRDLNLADARRYAETIINAGGLVNIQETGEFPETEPPAETINRSSSQDLAICPNCGFKQKKEDLCARCGWSLS